MSQTFKHRVLVAVLAAFLTFAFAAGELIVSPETHKAFAARKKREKKDEAPAQEAAPKKKTDDEGITTDKKDEDRIPLDQLTVKDDVKLTSKVGTKIDESIDKLLKILEQYQEPGTLRRLAEFYWKKAHQLSLDSMQGHQKKMEKWYEGGQKGKAPAEPNPDLWHRYNRKAVDLCKFIIDKFPKFPGMDEVYFFMGYNLNETGRDNEAVDYYKKLVREYPESTYVPDTWMAIGDYYFTHNNVYDALPAYEEVLKFQKSKVFGFAKYKIAWCYFNLGRYKDAIDTFKEVVAWSQEQSKGGKSQITLMEEALKDLVGAFAEEGDVDEAERYFLQVGGKNYFRMMLVRLADIYTNQGKLDESVKILRRLIREYPLHKDNPDFQVKIVEAFSNKNDKETTTKEIVNMVYYAKPPEESEWVKANIKNEPEKVEEAWENAERMLIKTVVEYHKEAIKVASEETWDKTQQLYETYLKYFSKSKTYYDVSFNYAELLYKRDKFKEAGQWYTKVAEMDPKGKHFEDASYSAILSFEKLVHEEIKAWVDDTQKRSLRKDKSYKLVVTKEAEEKEKAQRESYDERQMSENVQGFVKACNLYIDNIPQSKYKVDIIYKVAIIYYSHNYFDQAVDRFALIVKDYPTHRLAEYSANLILDSLNIKGRWRKLNETVRAFLKNKVLVNREAFRRDLMTLLEKSSFKKIEVTESEKNWIGAAKEYLEFATEFKKSEFVDKSLFNASVHYVTAGELEKSIEVQLRFLKECPKSSVAPKILFNLGKNYEALAYYDKAAERYEEYDKTYPNGENRKDALFNASVFHENLGHTDKALALKKKLFDITTDKNEKDQIDYQLGFTYLDQKNYKEAEKAFKAYLAKREKDITWPKYDKKTNEKLAAGKLEGDVNRIYGAHIVLLDLYRRENRKDDIDKTHDTILKLASCKTDAQLNDVAREAIAEARFYSLDARYKAYADLKLEVRNRIPQDKWNEIIKKKLEDKSKTAQEVQKAYEEVIELKSPRWSVASLYQIGQIYKSYSLSMFNSEIPYWLTEDQKVLYVEGIQRRAEPVERKALESLEKCLQTAYKTMVYTDYTEKARMDLAGYMPAAYPAINEIKFKWGFESESLFPPQFVTPKAADMPAEPEEAPAAAPAPEPAPAQEAAPAQAPAAEEKAAAPAQEDSGEAAEDDAANPEE